MKMVPPVPSSRACTSFAMAVVSSSSTTANHPAREPPGLHLQQKKERGGEEYQVGVAQSQ